MTFYFRPPSGVTQLQQLEKLAVTRLDFLLRLVVTNGDPLKVYDLLTDISTVEDSDCLIEGSRKDRISHFILRLAFAGRRDTHEFFRRAETLLFEIRFSNMDDNGLCNLLHSLDPFLRRHEFTVGLYVHDNHSTDVFQILKTFQDMLEQFGSWEGLIERYFSGATKYFLKVPFRFVLDLVRARSVTLKHGMAYVPLAKLRLVITAVFQTLVASGLETAKERYGSVIEDVRMKVLFSKLKYIFEQSQTSLSDGGRRVENVLSHAEIDMEAVYFPPCMSYLHKTLRERHRLRHHSRIQYTLFLKDAGLPVHDALMFWKQEYSLDSGGKNSCSHNWKRDARRYTYSIRHLYGLEGSRTNYRGHCCQSLQHFESGGCPFVHFDHSHLTDLLQSEGFTDVAMETVLKSSAEGDYQGACLEFLRHKCDILKTETTTTTTTDSQNIQSHDSVGFKKPIQENAKSCTVIMAGNLYQNSCENQNDSSGNKFSETLNRNGHKTFPRNKFNSDQDSKNLPSGTKHDCRDSKGEILHTVLNQSGGDVGERVPQACCHGDDAVEVSLISDSGDIEATPVCCHDDDLIRSNAFTILKPLDFYISVKHILCNK